MAESAELSTSLMEPDSTLVTPVPDKSPRAYVAQRKVTLIPPKKPVLVTRKRVAAYARVSRDSEQLMNSLSAQVSYYTDLINQTPEWENAGVYVDAGLTGTSIRARPEFQRLLSDCDAGKIEILSAVWIQSHDSPGSEPPFEYPLNPPTLFTIPHWRAFFMPSVEICPTLCYNMFHSS